MGNINYKDIICDNYYCQSVSFKPEWFSESSWNIDYNYNTINNSLKNDNKPYIIDKGIIKIYNMPSFNLILSKKLQIDFNEIKYLSIPINFRYNINNENNNEINIYIIFSNKLLLLNNIDNNNDIFYINLKLFKNYCIIIRSFNEEIIKKKIKQKKINTFSIDLENNLKMILVSEKLYNNNRNNIYENKYLKLSDINIENDFFLSIMIKNKNNLLENEFIELNFE
jgi:hypothetical protein